jgi:UDP-N-acetylmuramoyl-tripeptide--D-alanyl-D-alanine ligase
VLETRHPLKALQALGRAWRRRLNLRVVAVTGTAGKTSTKDAIAALLARHGPTHATEGSFNTWAGVPATLLGAREGARFVVVELGARREGQIAGLASIAEPDVGVITNVGAGHLETFGGLEQVAAAKAELLQALAPDGTAVVPAGESLLAPHLPDGQRAITFGPGGDVDHLGALRVASDEPHRVRNALAAVAALRALGLTARGTLGLGPSPSRGTETRLANGVVVVDDTYNANPVSMEAALKALVQAPGRRRIAVLGEMAELGDRTAELHVEIGALASRLGVDHLVAVGPTASAYTRGFEGGSRVLAGPEELPATLATIAKPGDRILVKGSRSADLPSSPSQWT